MRQPNITIWPRLHNVVRLIARKEGSMKLKLDLRKEIETESECVATINKPNSYVKAVNSKKENISNERGVRKNPNTDHLRTPIMNKGGKENRWEIPCTRTIEWGTQDHTMIIINSNRTDIQDQKQELRNAGLAEKKATQEPTVQTFNAIFATKGDISDINVTTHSPKGEHRINDMLKRWMTNTRTT